MLELPNFGHTDHIYITILLMTSWTDIMESWPLFENTFIWRRSRVAIFAGIIKIVTMSVNVKRIKSYVSKCNLCLYLLI